MGVAGYFGQDASPCLFFEGFRLLSHPFVVRPRFRSVVRLSLRLFLQFMQVGLVYRHCASVVFTPNSILHFGSLFRDSARFPCVAGQVWQRLLGLQLTPLFFRFSCVGYLLLVYFAS